MHLLVVAATHLCFLSSRGYQTGHIQRLAGIPNVHHHLQASFPSVLMSTAAGRSAGGGGVGGIGGLSLGLDLIGWKQTGTSVGELVSCVLGTVRIDLSKYRLTKRACC